jgi:hypothetical protein
MTSETSRVIVGLYYYVLVVMAYVVVCCYSAVLDVSWLEAYAS